MEPVVRIGLAFNSPKHNNAIDVQKDAIDELTGVQFLRTLRANMAH